MNTLPGLAPILCMLLTPVLCFGQQVRGSVGSVVRYVEVRPIRADTVDISLTTVDSTGRPVFEGRPVFCSASTCTFYRPGDVEHAVAAEHDVAATTWATGVQGLSAHVYMRVRQDLGGEFVWPRSDDAFDLVLGYGEFVRERYRVRLGRQRNQNGLGFTSFDGLSASVDVRESWSLEAYGGRSLARALEEPRQDALGPVENFIPDNSAWLIGGAAGIQTSTTAGSVRYQREIWSDRAALISERAAFDVRTTALDPVVVEAAADYDVAFNRLGKAHISVRGRLLDNRMNLEASARRYLPFFELWTIWGVFSPVPYHEVELRGAWRATERLDVDARVGLRRYSDTDAEVFIAPAEDESRRLALRARMRVSEPLTVEAEYRLESGFGAFLSSGEASAQWEAGRNFAVGMYGTVFQQILEFRTGEAAVIGFGGNVQWRIRHNIALNANATLYRQMFDNRPSAVDWTQRRASIGGVWTFGRDPGMVQ